MDILSPESGGISTKAFPNWFQSVSIMKYGKRAVDKADTEIIQKPTKVAKGVLKWGHIHQGFSKLISISFNYEIW